MQEGHLASGQFFFSPAAPFFRPMALPPDSPTAPAQVLRAEGAAERGGVKRSSDDILCPNLSLAATGRLPKYLVALSYQNAREGDGMGLDVIDLVSARCHAKGYCQRKVAQDIGVDVTCFNKFMRRRRPLPARIADLLREWLAFDGERAEKRRFLSVASLCN
jgi:hypothetical protein